MAVERNLAGIERDQPDHHIKGGGFAGAVRTQQSDNLAAFDVQGNILNDRACASAFWRTDTGYADGAPLEHFSVIFPVSLLRFRHSGSLRGRIHRAARDGTCSARIDPHTVFALAPWANRLKNALNRSAAFMAGFFDRAYCSSQAERQRLL